MNVKGYIGRQLRPSQLAAELLPPDMRWCALCHIRVPKKVFREHCESLSHRLAQKKQNKLKTLSMEMWEKHRGASIAEESPRDADFDTEFAKFKQNQAERERSALQAIWKRP